MVLSTSSGLSLPWMCFMATPARFIARKVSWLILADSMAFICCSMVPMWLIVCSRSCSRTFLRFNAALAAIADKGSVDVLEGHPGDDRTCLVCADVLPRNLLLLLYLPGKMDLTLLQHIQLRPQVEDDILGRIFPFLRGATAEPAPDT